MCVLMALMSGWGVHLHYALVDWLVCWILIKTRRWCCFSVFDISLYSYRIVEQNIPS